MQPEPIETHAEWRHDDVADSSRWIERLSAREIEELDAALRHAQAKSNDLLDITKDDFPLPTLGGRLKRVEQELIDGRGFVLLRGLPRQRYDNDQMCLLYWGIGMHLGKRGRRTNAVTYSATLRTKERRSTTRRLVATKLAVLPSPTTRTDPIWSD